MRQKPRTWTYEDNVRLIECYNRRMPSKEMAVIFNANPLTLNSRISQMRKTSRYGRLFKINKYHRGERKTW
jgi:hypothetical protein